MVQIAERGSASVGVIDPVVAALQAAGEVLEVEYRNGRGDPALVWLDGSLDRDAVEEQFDLGPLLQWWPSPYGWQLIDTTTLTRTEPRRGRDHAVRPAAQGGRVRAGYADQDVDLATSAWAAPDPAVEVSAVRERRDDSGRTLHDYWAFVSMDDPADLRARVEEVLAAVLPPLAEGQPPNEVVDRLPDWFRDRCAAPYVQGRMPVLPGGPGEGAGLDAEQAAADAVRTARWATYWTAENWLRAMTPAERTWAWSSFEEVAPGVARLRYQRRVLGAPVGSLKWLLHVCGAARCVPPPWPVDQYGRRPEETEPAAPAAPPAAPSSAPSAAAPPTHVEGGTWSRLVRRLRGER